MGVELGVEEGVVVGVPVTVGVGEELGVAEGVEVAVVVGVAVLVGMGVMVGVLVTDGAGELGLFLPGQPASKAKPRDKTARVAKTEYRTGFFMGSPLA